MLCLCIFLKNDIHIYGWVLPPGCEFVSQPTSATTGLLQQTMAVIQDLRLAPYAYKASRLALNSFLPLFTCDKQTEFVISVIPIFLRNASDTTMHTKFDLTSLSRSLWDFLLEPRSYYCPSFQFTEKFSLHIRNAL